MAAGYHLKETIYFCSEYLSALDPKGSIVWKIPQTTKEADQVLAHSHTIIKMDKDLYNEVQTYILKNTEEMRVWEVHYNIENDIRKERRIKWMTEKWGGPTENLQGVPDELLPLPSYSDWLPSAIKVAKEGGLGHLDVNEFVEELARGPNEYCGNTQTPKVPD
jgi:hypothetical protein